MDQFDLVNLDNAQNVVEVAAHCTEHMRATEVNLHPSLNSISHIQPDITERMRAVLISWLVEVHTKYALRPETLFITVNLIDRFC